MIHYYTNREISKKLEVNLARWKRWARSFLPPDPLGGLQSGYARQYGFEDLFKVFLGGFLLAHLKLSLPESRLIVADLSPWLKRNGFFSANGSRFGGERTKRLLTAYRVYFCRLGPSGAKSGSVFAYLIRKTIDLQPEDAISSGAGSDGVGSDGLVRETIQETIIGSAALDAKSFFLNPEVRLINLSALFAMLIEKLHRPTAPIAE